MDPVAYQADYDQSLRGQRTQARLADTIISQIGRICEGKKFTKRHLTKLHQALPCYQMCLEHIAGMCHLRVTNRVVEVCLLIYYHSSPIIRESAIRQFNQCYLLGEQRAKVAEDQVERLPELIQRHNVSIESIQAFNRDVQQALTTTLPFGWRPRSLTVF